MDLAWLVPNPILEPLLSSMGLKNCCDAYRLVALLQRRHLIRWVPLKNNR